MTFLQRYRYFLIAFLTSVIIFVPQFAFDFLPEFRGLYLSASSDETHYVTQVREVAEGWWWLPNSYIAEGRSGPSNLYWWISLPLGLIFRVWPGQDVASFVLTCKVLGFAACIWCLLRLVRFVRPDWSTGWVAACVAGFFFLSPTLGLSMPVNLLQTLTGRGDWWEFLAWTRFSNPVVSGALFLGFILLWIQWAEKPTIRRMLILGVLGGLMAWIYLFFWMFLCVMLATWNGLLLIRKRFDLFKTAVIVPALTGLLGLTYVAWVRFQSHGSKEFAILGPQLSHAPIFEKTVIGCLILFLLAVFVRARKERRTLENREWSFVALALTTVFAVNHQIITGQSFEPHHFYFITDMPLAGLLLVFAAREALGVLPWKRATAIMGWGVAALLLASAVGIQVATVHNIQERYASYQRYVPAFAWMNQWSETPVILANDDASELIPMYTKADVYFALHATTYTTTPAERRLHAFYVQERLRGITVDRVVAEFETRRDYIGSTVFTTQYYRAICGSRGCFPQSVMDELVNGYQAFLKKDFLAELKRYRVDALLWDEKMDATWHLEQYPFLEKAGMWDGVSIWTFRPETVTTP